MGRITPWARDPHAMFPFVLTRSRRGGLGNVKKKIEGPPWNARRGGELAFRGSTTVHEETAASGVRPVPAPELKLIGVAQVKLLHPGGGVDECYRFNTN